MSNIIETPASPVPAAFLVFDGTTGALVAGSWGASVSVTVPDTQWQIDPSYGTSGAGLPGDVFADVEIATIAGAGYRAIIQTPPGGGSINLAAIDATGAVMALPPNTRIFARLFRRNGAIG